MSEPLDRFEYRSTEDPETIASYLDALRDGFKEHRLRLRSGTSEMEVRPEELLQLAVAAVRSPEGVRLSITVSWRERNHDEQGPADKLTISSTTPDGEE